MFGILNKKGRSLRNVTVFLEAPLKSRKIWKAIWMQTMNDAVVDWLYFHMWK